MIYIAIVATITAANQGMSKRSHGDWASFIGPDRTKVIQRAKAAAKAWKTAGDYRLYLGTLTEAETLSGWEAATWPEVPAAATTAILDDSEIPF